jgi:hypothetical protein
MICGRTNNCVDSSRQASVLNAMYLSGFGNSKELPTIMKQLLQERVGAAIAAHAMYLALTSTARTAKEAQ